MAGNSYHLTRPLAVVLLLTQARALDNSTCGGLGNDNCRSCTGLNLKHPDQCSWCADLLECVPGHINCTNVNHDYQCPDEDATPTLFEASTATGPVNGDFGLTLKGLNFGINASAGHEAGDTRPAVTVRVGPFNCTTGFQSNVSLEFPALDKYPYDMVSCARMPGVGFNLTTCVETRGSDLCTKCGFRPDKGKSSCPDWLQSSSAINPLFTYSAPKLLNATADCLEKVGDTCMIRAGMNLTLTGVNFAPSQQVVDAFNTKVTLPDRTATRWDPMGMKGLELTLGRFPCMLPYHVVNESSVVCSIGYGTGKNNHLGLEVGGIHMSGANFGFFEYQPPSLAAISPGSGPSYGEQVITITGAGFGPDVANVSVSLTGAGSTVVLSPFSVNDTMIKLLSPASNSSDQLKWTVKVIAGGEPSNTSLVYVSESCTDSCKGISRASGTCSPAGICQCEGVTRFLANTSTCACDDANPCVHGTADCTANTCVCDEDWEFAPAPAPMLLGVCTKCDLSCRTLQKEVTGGNNCHCAFNKLHLIWIVLAPLFLVVVAVWLYRGRQAQQADAVKVDEEATEPLANVSNEAPEDDQ